MNISKIHNCYGCGVCAISCTKNIISIELNDNGFYEPRISDVNKCTDCGLCFDVCAYSHDEISLQNLEIHSYAAWSNDSAVRRKCSSGGVGFELGRMMLSKGYKVCGVRYNAEVVRAEHYIATTLEELIQSIGSKYIQSYTVDGFKGISRKEKYLVTGTPCQIDSFRRYIRRFRVEDNFVLMDFFCHGVPSMFVWQKYLKDVEKVVGKVTYASWRNKWRGWHDSWAIGIDGEKHGKKVNWHDSYNSLIKERKTFVNSRLSQGDKFYALFFGDGCLGGACYDHCKYKYKHSSADIRIGDAWGTCYKKDEDGVSAVITFTSIGNEWLKKANLHIEQKPFDVVAELQIKKASKRTLITKILMKELKKESSTIDDVYAIQLLYNKLKRLIRRISNPKKTIVNFFNRFSSSHSNKLNAPTLK